MRLRSKTSTALIAALAVATLASCSAPAATDDGRISVVASTSVYGDIAQAVGGDNVRVTSIISGQNQDPHSFEADARVQLELSRADVVIENGGGYDDFIGQLLASLDVPDQVLLNAVAISPLNLVDEHDDGEPAEEVEDHDHGSFNEHVWYDFATIDALVGELEDAFTERDPGNRDSFESNADALRGELDALAERAAGIRSAHDGTGVAITEPVPVYLLESAGLHNVTPAEFSAAIEEGSGVAPSVLSRTLELFAGGDAKILVYNDQTTSPETTALLQTAKTAGIPVVAVTELLPPDTDYIGWMTANLDALESALDSA